MQPESIELYFREGSSDKVYHLRLVQHIQPENMEDQWWSVHAQWGRRGSALQSAMKANHVPYEEAKHIYDRIIREKTGKNYQVAQAADGGAPGISVGLPSAKERSGHTPELLTPIEEPEALQLVSDSSWWFQQKFDGRRLAVQKSNGQYSGINKLGQIIPIDSCLVQALGAVQAEEFLVDGEITDSRFHVWDILSVNNIDLRNQPYETRYLHLTRWLHITSEVLRVASTAMAPKTKKAFVEKMHEIGAEGFVCKNRSAVYAPGRAGQHFKCKFVSTASFIVGPKPEKNANGHRSIGVYLLDGTRLRFMGNVGVPDRYWLPQDGEIVEIRYLYCHPGPDGKLIQAKYFGQIRNDVDRSECSVSQLKLKASEDGPGES